MTDYSTLKPADAVHHLNEAITAEVERFEKDTSLRLASIKIKRDRETEDLKTVEAHVR